MSTSAERQRKRRQRLRQEGYVDVTVTVPRTHTHVVRQFAKNPDQPVDAGRLITIIHALKAIRPALQKAGIEHAGVFGSSARGDHGPDSDIDILIEINAKRVGDILAYVDVTNVIKEAISAKYPALDVDVADQATLKPLIHRQAERDAIYAF